MYTSTLLRVSVVIVIVVSELLDELDDELELELELDELDELVVTVSRFLRSVDLY